MVSFAKSNALKVRVILIKIEVTKEVVAPKKLSVRGNQNVFFFFPKNLSKLPKLKKINGDFKICRYLMVALVPLFGEEMVE